MVLFIIGEVCNGDDYGKLNMDILFLTDRLRIWKKKLRNTPWYHILTHIRLRKELLDIEEDVEEIGERLQKLDVMRKNPIQLVKRI
jgi:hypothetical protein